MTDVTDDLDGAASILLKAPSMGGTRELCTDLLTGGLDEPGVLFVSFTRQASTCVDQVDEAAVGRLGVITVGDGGTEVADADVTVSSISSPSDLTGLGIEIGQVLSEWEAPVAVCFDSLTAMLQYVDFETAYEFLHALTGQLYAADARAHYHIDPGAHDPMHVEGITSLFDAAVTVGEDGQRDVRTRDVIA
jgi:hypothetical protein